MALTRDFKKTVAVSLTGLMEPPMIGSNGASSGLPTACIFHCHRSDPS
jgi:hypothetical protein